MTPERGDGIVIPRSEAHRSFISPVGCPGPARQTMQQGVEALFSSRGCLAEEDAGLARNATGRVHLASVSKLLQRIEQQRGDAFLRGRGALASSANPEIFLRNGAHHVRRPWRIIGEPDVGPMHAIHGLRRFTGAVPSTACACDKGRRCRSRGGRDELSCRQSRSAHCAGSRWPRWMRRIPSEALNFGRLSIGVERGDACCFRLKS